MYMFLPFFIPFVHFIKNANAKNAIERSSYDSVMRLIFSVMVLLPYLLKQAISRHFACI